MIKKTKFLSFNSHSAGAERARKALGNRIDRTELHK